MTDSQAPTLYLLHGDDELASAEYVDRLRDKLGDPTAVALNVHDFDADGLDFGDLAQACRAAPVLAKRRLVIVRRATQLASDEARRSRLEDLLRQLPPSTALVLIQSETLPKASPLLRLAAQHAPSSHVREFPIPHGEAFARWVRDRCRLLGGEIEPQAAFLLAELVGDDPRLADQELTKLLDYVDRRRPIGAPDVELLTPFAGQSDVFAMVDALGARDGPTALTHLHRVLDSDSPQYALAMIIRQFRLLLLAREAIELGQDPRQTMRIHPYVAGKVAAQSRHFSLAELERILHSLLTLDLEIKTGQTDDRVGLDALVAGLTT